MQTQESSSTKDTLDQLTKLAQSYYPDEVDYIIGHVTLEALQHEIKIHKSIPIGSIVEVIAESSYNYGSLPRHSMCKVIGWSRGHPRALWNIELSSNTAWVTRRCLKLLYQT